VDQRYYRGGEPVSHLLPFVFLCGGFVMDWTNDQKIEGLKECIEESKSEISYAQSRGDDFMASEATQVLKMAEAQLKTLTEGVQ
jgi:hypothetical protein